MSNSKTRVTVEIADRQGELEIVDGHFNVVGRGFGILDAELMPGLYKVRAQAGDGRTEDLFVVEPEAKPFTVPINPLCFATPVPLLDTLTGHNDHRDALVKAIGDTPIDVGLESGASMLLGLRDPSDACVRQCQASPTVQDHYRRSFDGFRLRSPTGDLMLDFDRTARRVPDQGFAVLNFKIRPGPYVLSYEPKGIEPVAMPVLAVGGWQSQVFINLDLPEHFDAPGRPNLADRAVMMAPLGRRFQADDHYFRLAEIARYALIQGRQAITHERLKELLWEKFQNPILGLFAAHLLLLEKRPNRDLLDMVTGNIADMIGADFPDVLALRIALAELDNVKPDLPQNGLPFPPLLRPSWNLIVDHSELFPVGSITRKVASRLVPNGPWLAWQPIGVAEEFDVVDTAVELLATHARTLFPQALDKITEFTKGFDTGRTSDQPDGVVPKLATPEVVGSTSSASAELTPPADDASAALETIIKLAREFLWPVIFARLRAEAAERGLMTHLTNLQKSLLPTLQLISAQLDEGYDFTLTELKQLRGGLGVPLPVLRESLEDLLKKILALGWAIIVEKVAVPTQSQNHLEEIFESALEHLPEDLRKPNEVPTVVSLIVQNDGISLSDAAYKMRKRLSREVKRLRAEWQKTRTDYTKMEITYKIDEEIDKLRIRLVEVLRDIPKIWSDQKSIAHLEPLQDIIHVFSIWRRKDDLKNLVGHLNDCPSYETLHRYKHPLLEIENLATYLDMLEPDVEDIEQSVWILLKGKGKPGVEIISDRLGTPLRQFFTELAELLEVYVLQRSSNLSTRSRRRIIRMAEHLIADLPPRGDNSKPSHLQVQDLTWRAVLLDKAGELSQAAGLAAKALELADGMSPTKKNEFMWLSRLGDANRIVAKASGFADHDGWEQCIKFYDEALKEAHHERITMVYLRQAEALADRLALFDANSSVATATKMCRIAENGYKIAEKAEESANNPTMPLFMKARLWASLASARKIAEPHLAAAAEREFEMTVAAILERDLRHTGAIWLAWRFYDEKGDEDDAIKWLDQQVKRLREPSANNENKMNSSVADHLEFQAARYMLDLGRQDEAQLRLYRMVTETQCNNLEARRELFRIKIDTSQESLAQELYKDAYKQPAGSQIRKDYATEALKKNECLIYADPGKEDVVPWTRHARLLLLMDEFDKASVILEELRVNYPQDPYVWFHLGEAYYRQGVGYETESQSSQAQESYVMATTAFEKAWGIAPRVDTADRLASCWTRRRDLEKAKHMLLEAEKLDPEDGRTKLSLGWSHYRAGEINQALQSWGAALHCLCESEEQMNPREMELARQAANAIIRFADEPMVTEVPLERLGSSALRRLASAASSAGWNRSKITESMGACLNSLPLYAGRRVPHALRAHLLYLQLAEGNDAAYQWHRRWFEKFAEVNDPKLFFEYATGAKGVFRRAVLWSLSRGVMNTDSYCVPDISGVVLDEKRWGKFLRVASTWGPQENYYQNAYAEWPPDRISRDELWDVVCRLNTELFRAAFNEIDSDLTQPELINLLKVVQNLPFEEEIFPAIKLDPDAPASILVKTDEFHSCILLNESMDIVNKYAKSGIKKNWDVSGDRLCRSLYDGAKVPLTEVKLLNILASRNDCEVTINERGGLNLAWDIWSQDANTLWQFGSGVSGRARA